MSLTRRSFLGGSAALLASRVVASPNDRLNLAVIGVGGRGRRNLEAVQGENVVALCDVDAITLGQAAALFPKATLHRDFRRMLEQEKAIDGVVVSTRITSTPRRR